MTTYDNLNDNLLRHWYAQMTTCQPNFVFQDPVRIVFYIRLS